MAVEVDSLGAHVGGGRLFGPSNEFGRGLLELGSEHIVGVVAETVIAQGDVRRFSENLLAISAEAFHPDVTQAGCGETLFERIAIEVRQPARHGKGSNVGQSLDLVRLQRGQQLVEGAGGVADGVESGQKESAQVRTKHSWSPVNRIRDRPDK